MDTHVDSVSNLIAYWFTNNLRLCHGRVYSNWMLEFSKEQEHCGEIKHCTFSQSTQFLFLLYLIIYKWGFPKMGLPPNHQF